MIQNVWGKRILSIILCFLIYTIILATIIIGREEFIDWKAHTFDLDGDGIFGGIEYTEEQNWWFTLLVHDTRIFMIFLVPLGSGLFTLITGIIVIIAKRIKHQNTVKIAILYFLIYFTILNLLVFIWEASKIIDTRAFIAGVTKEWEYWVIESLFFAPRLLFLSEIFTLITWEC